MQRGMVMLAGLVIVVPAFYMGFIARYSAALWIGVAAIVVVGTIAGLLRGPNETRASASVDDQSRS
jgi:hypothetical protein